jgi:rare lipoprotein A
LISINHSTFPEIVMSFTRLRRPWLGAMLALGCGLCMAETGARADRHAHPAAHARHTHPVSHARPRREAVKPHAIDLSGKPRRGKASYYANSFKGRKMADGTPMNPNANIAASKTLPLGTTAKVTNLETGKSEVVEIRDRGPYVGGRIVDVSPKVAKDLEMKKDGVAPVVVTPLKVPLPDGGVKTGTALVDPGSADTSSGR